MPTSSYTRILVCFLLVGCSQGENKQPQVQAQTQSPAQTAEKSEADTPASQQTAQTAETKPAIDIKQTMAEIEKHFADGNYREAFPLLDQLHAAKVCPPEGYAIRAQILDHSGLVSQSIASMTMALTKKPDNPEWHNMLGLLFVKAQNLSMAQQAFTKAIELDNKFAKAHNNRGLMYIGLKEYGQATNDFNAAIQASPEYVDAHNNRGYAYLEQGNFAEAIKNFSEAIKIDPDYVKGYNNRGFALMKTGDAEAAVADFTKAIELSPNVVKHYLHRRDAYLAMGKQAEADRDLAEAQWMQNLMLVNRKVQRNASNPAVFVERAEHYASFKRYDRAFEDLARALKLDETYADAYSAKAKIHFEKQEYQQAVDYCTKALEFEQDFEARSLRGDAYLAMNQLDQAIEDFQSVQRFDGAVAVAFWKRAEFRKEKGDKKGAEQDLKTALQLDPQVEKNQLK